MPPLGTGAGAPFFVERARRRPNLAFAGDDLDTIEAICRASWTACPGNQLIA